MSNVCAITFYLTVRDLRLFKLIGFYNLVKTFFSNSVDLLVKHYFFFCEKIRKSLMRNKILESWGRLAQRKNICFRIEGTRVQSQRRTSHFSNSRVNLFHIGSTFEERKFVGKKKTAPSTKERSQLPLSERVFLAT